MKYGIQFNASGLITATFSGVALDPLFSEISEADYLDIVPGSTFMNGVVSGPVQSAAQILEQAQTAQIALIQNSANLAKTAPMSFTNGAGNTSSFPMDPVHQTEYLGAYSAFVLGGETLPSGFGFEDVNSVIIPMAVADIKAFYAQGVAGINAITAKKATLVSQINQATSVSAVQAIVW